MLCKKKHITRLFSCNKKTKQFEFKQEKQKCNDVCKICDNLNMQNNEDQKITRSGNKLAKEKANTKI